MSHASFNFCIIQYNAIRTVERNRIWELHSSMGLTELCLHCNHSNLFLETEPFAEANVGIRDTALDTNAIQSTGQSGRVFSLHELLIQ